MLRLLLCPLIRLLVLLYSRVALQPRRFFFLLLHHCSQGMEALC